MKKYKIIIALFTGLYLVLALILSITMNHFADKQNNEYRVEISRLSHEIMNSEVLKDGKDNDIMVIDANRYSGANDIFNIYRVTYLSVDTDHSNVISEFYSSRNKYQMEIVPVIKEEQVIGYLRFDYKKDIDVSSFCRLSQGFLLLIYLLTVSILIYTDQRIIKPFHQLSNMPYELSKGNLYDGIKESKNRYFGRFIWGIGMLRDALESHKNKELKLARDKKMILLSISHDIKTPLNAINLYAKALEQGLYDTEEEKSEAVVKIQEKTIEINEFVKDIMKSTTEDVISIEVNNSEYYLTELIN